MEEVFPVMGVSEKHGQFTMTLRGAKCVVDQAPGLPVFAQPDFDSPPVGSVKRAWIDGDQVLATCNLAEGFEPNGRLQVIGAISGVNEDYIYSMNVVCFTFVPEELGDV